MKTFLHFYLFFAFVIACLPLAMCNISCRKVFLLFSKSKRTLINPEFKSCVLPYSSSHKALGSGSLVTPGIVPLD